jgi:3-methyladenine DNA glycosylase/8-oxoguanine DNA glycosylase
LNQLQVEVRPRWPFRLPRYGGPDRVAQVRAGRLVRLLHVDGSPVLAAASQPARDRVVLAARAAERPAAEEAIARMRFALGVDDDLRAFHERFRWHPLIGRALRRDPCLRVRRRPDPWEALAWAVCEQLIEFRRAVGIERRIVARLGPRCPRTGLRDVPDAARVARAAPALLESCDLAGGRALALVRVAREVAAGRIDLHASDHERAWRRLRTIPNVGSWTLEKLAFEGQGRDDQLPAGDLAYVKLVGRAAGLGRRATEEEVREFFAPYAPFAGLAGIYARASHYS